MSQCGLLSISAISTGLSKEESRSIMQGKLTAVPYLPNYFCKVLSVWFCFFSLWAFNSSSNGKAFHALWGSVTWSSPNTTCSYSSPTERLNDSLSAWPLEALPSLRLPADLVLTHWTKLLQVDSLRRWERFLINVVWVFLCVCFSKPIGWRCLRTKA